MKDWTLFVTLIAVLFGAAHFITPHALGAIPDEPPAVEQRIKDLASDDAAVRETARKNLATVEALPYLETAVCGEDAVTTRAAAEILVGLLDSENADTAGQAEQAVANLEKSPNEKVIAVIKAALQGREQSIAVELNRLGWRASSPREGELQISQRETPPPQLDRSGRPVIAEPAPPTIPLAHLKRLRRPFHIHVSIAPGKTDIGELAALKDLDNLASISLTVFASDGDLAPVATLPRVRQLSVRFVEGATGSQLEPLAQLEDLEQLAFIRAPSLEGVFPHFSRLPKVSTLRITFSPDAVSSGLADLSKMSQLEVLSLEDVPDMPAVMPQIGTLKKLKRLTLRGRNVTDQELVYVGQAIALESINLQDTAITDDGLVHLKDLPELRGLQLQAASLTDDALPHLLAMKKLEGFSAPESFISAASLKQLNPAQFPMQPDVDLQDTALEPVQRQIVRDLTKQGIWVSPRRRDEAGKPLLGLSIAVTIPEQWQGDDAVLNELIELGQIDRLVIAAPIAGEWTNRLSELTTLEEISLINTGMADDELQFLTQLPNMKSIELRGPFTDNALSTLRKTTAWRINLAQTLISDSGRKSLTAALTANRDRGRSTEQLEELERARVLVAKACEPVPKDSREQMLANREKNQLRRSLFGLGVKAVPLLGETAQNADSERRTQAILNLMFIGNRYFSIGGSSPEAREALLAEVQTTFQHLWEWDKQSGLVRADEEKSLLQLGALGGRVMQTRYDRNGYDVWICGEWTGGDAGLECLTHLTTLTSLRIYCDAITPQALAVFKSLPDLTNLELAIKEVNRTALENLAPLKKLSRLAIATKASDDAFDSLAGMDSLSSLRVMRIPDAALQPIGQIRQLKYLSISGNDTFTGAGLQYLAAASQLESLEVNDTRGFHGDGLQHLTGLTSLKNLSFTQVGRLGAELAPLAQFPALEELRIQFLPLTPESVRHIGNAKQLNSLNLQFCALLDDDLKSLADMPKLARLSLQENCVTDEGIAHLTSLPALREVRFDHTFVTSDGVTKLLARNGNSEPSPGMMHLAEEMRNRTIAATPELLEAAKKVTSLGAYVSPGQDGMRATIPPNWSGGDEGLSLLLALGNLSSLQIQTALSDSAIPYLKKLTTLKYLNLDNNQISDAAFRDLQGALPNTNITRPEPS